MLPTALPSQSSAADADVPFPFVYHMTHYRNLESILEQGIYSRSAVISRQVAVADISDSGVQHWRARPEPVFHRPIHDYVPLYINPRNPMLSCRRRWQHELVVLAFSRLQLAQQVHLYSDGNAASAATRFSADAHVLELAREVLQAPRWTDHADGKRRRCAEMLVHEHIAPERISEVLCPSEALAHHVASQCDASVRVPGDLYFD